MKFVTLTPEAFRAYAQTSPYKSFRQTPEVAQYRAQEGWQAYYFGVEADAPKAAKKSARSARSAQRPSKSSRPSLLAAALLVGKTTFLGRKTFYALGGPLLDLENAELTEFFFTHLKTFLKSQNAYVLQIVPYYELRERDRDGRPVQGGFDHRKALDHLRRLGFRPVPESIQEQYLSVIDLNGRSEAEVLASFSQNVRRSLRRAEKQGVKVRPITRDELPLFKEITADTAARRHFADQTLTYYERMYDLFVPRNEAAFLFAEIDDPNHPGQALPISAAMFLMPYGAEVCYFSSGSRQEYMKSHCAQYLVQWRMLQYAIQHGFKRYNFEGIRGLPDPDSPGYAAYRNSPEYGIYQFKRGFGAHVVELIGTFELPLQPSVYRLHASLAKLAHLLHR